MNKNMREKEKLNINENALKAGGCLMLIGTVMTIIGYGLVLLLLLGIVCAVIL